MKKKELKNKKNIIITIILILITLLFFSYNLSMTWDSSEYLGLSTIIGSNEIAENWIGHRGIAFPLLLKIAEPFNIHSSFTLLLLMFLFYISMIFILYTFYKKLVNNKILTNKIDKFIFIVYSFIFIILNPIIFGYYHTVLTEFVAITTILLICYLSLNWIDILWNNNKKQFILYTLIFSLIITFIYHIKQSFIIGCITPIMLATFISIIHNFNFKNIISKIIATIFIFLVLVGSIKLWYIYMQTVGKNNSTSDIKIENSNTVSVEKENSSNSTESNKVNVSTSTTNARVKGRIIIGLNSLKPVCYHFNYKDYNFDANDLSSKDISEIEKILSKKSKYTKFRIFKTYKNKYIVNYSKYDYNFKEDLIFYLKVLFNSPIDIYQSYKETYKHIVFFNYTGNIYDYSENSVIPIRIFRKNILNLIDLNPNYSKYIINYTTINNPNFIAKLFNMYTLEIGLKPIITLTKISLWILPIITLLFLIYSIIFKKYSKSKEFDLINILNFTSLSGIMSYVAFGTNIDRYTVFIMAPVFISYLLIANHFVKLINSRTYIL